MAAYIRGHGPVARGGGRQAPISFFFGHGPRCKFEKKLHLGPVAPHRATGGIFEILIFFKYKKEKSPRKPTKGEPVYIYSPVRTKDDITASSTH